MSTRLNCLLRADPMLYSWFKVEPSVVVSTVYPFADPLMAETPKLRWILGLQDSLDPSRFEWITYFEAGVHYLGPYWWVKPVHVLPWGWRSTFWLRTNRALCLSNVVNYDGCFWARGFN